MANNEKNSKHKKGLIYIMTTVVPGLIKVGHTAQIDERTRNLTKNGYQNVTGLQPFFVIEVDDMNAAEDDFKKEFANQRVGKTELFALDAKKAKAYLEKKYSGITVPKEEFKDRLDSSVLPDRQYKNTRDDATLDIKDGVWKILKGSKILNDSRSGVSDKARQVREQLNVKDGILLEDITLNIHSASHASEIVNGYRVNAWKYWKDQVGFIDRFRHQDED